MPDDLRARHPCLVGKQASLLRRLARGEGLNEAIDWEHVIEEVEDVGASELHGCQSQISQALLHLLKLGAEPQSQAAAHWRSEVYRLPSRGEAALLARNAPALRPGRPVRHRTPSGPGAYRCPRRSTARSLSVTGDDLLVPKPDLENLVEKLRPPPTV